MEKVERYERFTKLLDYNFNTKIMSWYSRRTMKQMKKQTSLAKMNSDNSKGLIVEVNIKGKLPRNIFIRNIDDQHHVDKQILLFMTINNLKQKAFDFIKGIIYQAISKRKWEQEILRIPLADVNHLNLTVPNTRFDKSQNLGQLKETSFNSTFKDLPWKGQTREVDMQINPDEKNEDKKIIKEDSFGFNSSFSYPSPINSQDKSLFSDNMFSNTSQLQNRSISKFSTINELNSQEHVKQTRLLDSKMNKICLLSSRRQKTQTRKTKQQKQNCGRNRVKIILSNRSAHKENKNQSPLPAARLNSSFAIKDMSNQKQNQKLPTTDVDFLIYDTNHLKEQTGCVKQTQIQSSIPEYLENDLKQLFVKLTANNPDQVQEIDSKYVSYGALGRAQLLLMGALLQKMDHRDLNQLDFTHFKRYAAKHCWKQIQNLHLIKQKSKRKIDWFSSKQNNTLL